MTSSMDGAVRLWDLDKPQQPKTFETGLDAVYAVDFSPTDPIVAATGCRGMVIIWNHETGKRLKVLRFGEEFFCSLAFSTNGRILAVGTSDELIFLVDIPVDLDEGDKRGSRGQTVKGGEVGVRPS